VAQPADINRRLGELTAYLNRKSRRFTASLRMFRVRGGAGLPPDELVRRAFGPVATAVASAPVELGAALDLVEAALAWGGEPGAHPNPRVLTDPAWQVLVEAAIGELGELMAPAPAIYALTLGEGHPFEPVWWDLTLAFAHDDDALLLVGAATD
jgi:hypothetical protein